MRKYKHFWNKTEHIQERQTHHLLLKYKWSRVFELQNDENQMSAKEYSLEQCIHFVQDSVT